MTYKTIGSYLAAASTTRALVMSNMMLLESILSFEGLPAYVTKKWPVILMDIFYMP